MEKEDKKSGRNGRGLDTIGKRILVLTIAILMTFQFCTPTFYGVSFAEDYTQEDVETLAEQADNTAEATDPEEVQPVDEAQGGDTAEPVLEDQPAETGDIVSEEAGDDTQGEPVVSEEGNTDEQPAEQPAEEPAEQPAEPVQDEPTEEPQEEPAETVELNGDWMYFEKEVNGVNVFVTAEPDTFPVGTEMKVEAVSNAVVQDAVEEAMGGNVGDFRAVDITFYTEEESDIQPLKPVSVQMATNAFESEENLTVVHVEDAYENIAEVVELDEASSDDTTAVFDADGFSIYVVAETPADTYNFVVNGETVRTQKVVAGDYLYEPDTPTDPDGNKFIGWFIGDEELVFGSNGRTTIESASNTTVTVTARFDKVYYVTFRDQDGGVFSRVGVKSGETVSDDDLPTFIPKQSTQNLAGWSTTKDADGIGTAAGKVTFPLTVTADVVLYPIIETGYWIHFDANRSHTTGMENVNVSYTPPVFVKQGTNSTAPTKNPVADIAAYTFEGWYTDPECTQRYTFGRPLTEDIILYANWNVGQAHYNVVIWQQKVTDNKTATGDARSWDYVTSYDRTADIGATVTYNSLPNNIRNLSYTGFTRDHYDTSITVAADGSSTLNVYYRRNLMTFNFKVVRYNNQWRWDYDAYDYSSYAQNWRTITGLYGQTFAQASEGLSAAEKANYVWPASYVWYDGSENQTLLTAFTETETPKDYYYRGEKGTDYPVHHVRQKADGTWPSASELSSNEDIAYTSGGNFNVTNKYNTFHAVAYSKRTYYQDTTGRTSATPGSTQVTGDNKYPLYIYHARNEYTIEFYNGNSKIDNANKLYEASLSEYASKTLTPADEAQYSFGGWSFTPDEHDANNAIDWSQQTMPARTLRVYAIWVPIAYNVQLNLGADDATMDANQSRNFWPQYGATIDDTYMMNATRPGYRLVGWYDANDNPWDFANAVTKDLCDEGPIYDAQYKNNYYILHLTAKWRIDANIGIAYDLNGGTGNIVDEESYVQYGSFVVSNTKPTPPEGKHFVGWLDKKGYVHQPGDTVAIDDEALFETVDNKLCVLLTAIYTTDVPKATITYHANYEGGAADVVVGPKEWNDTETPSASTFTRPGYTLVGWNNDQAAAAAGTVKFENGEAVYVSAMTTDAAENPEPNKVGNNDLYAVWRVNVTAVITGSSLTETYDGTEKSNSTYTVTYYVGEEEVTAPPAGVTLTLTPENKTATGTDAGTYSVQLAGTLTSTNSQYAIPENAVTYDEEYEGKIILVINPASVTLTANSGTETYDGNEKTVTGYTSSVEGLTFEGVSASGSGTDAGTYPVTFTGVTVGTTKDSTGNYVVSGTTNGTLTINPASVTLTANSGTETYDGTEKTVTGFTPSITGLTFTGVSASGSGTDAGEYPVTFTGVTVGTTKDSTGNYVVSGTTNGTLTINPASVTLTANSGTETYDGNEKTVTGYTSSVEGLTFEGVSASGSGTNAGTYPVTFTGVTVGTTKDSTGNYVVSGTTNGTLTINPASVTLTANSDNKTYNGSEQTLTGFTSSVTGLTFEGVSASGSGTDAGEYPVTFTGVTVGTTTDSTGNYVVTGTTPGTLTIDPKAVRITAKSEEFTYDGTAHSNNGYDVDGLVGNDAISAVVEGSITFPSESPVTNEVKSHEFTTGNANNYTVSYVNGRLTMKKAEVAITITAASDEWTYDGAAHENTSVTVTSGQLLTGDTLSATATGSVTNVADTADGNNPIAEGYKIMHGTEDVTANYVITPVDGTLTINPKAVTVTAKSEAFIYDGTAHSNAGYDVDGLVGNDKITAVVEGSITFPSESPVANVVKSHQFTTGTAGNYTVSYVDGELTMTKANVAITITAASDEWTYDGEAHSNSAVTVTSGSLMTGDSLVATATGSVTNVADTAAGNNPIAAGYKIMHGEEDVTANYAITTVAGKLTINPKAVTVTAQDKEFTYTGEAQSWNKYDVDGLVGNDAITATVTGSITFPSESPVTNTLASYEFTTGTPGNYTVTTANGQLTMKKAEVAITITAASDEWTYDGEAHKNNSVTVTSGALLAGDTLSATATGSVTNVADTADGNNPIATGYKIMHGEEDVTANYVITPVNGTLTIDPKAVTVTAKSEEFTYDGTAHSNSGYDVVGLVGSDAINATVTGSITFPSESPVTNKVESYSFTTGTAGNYTVTTENGQLTMKKANVAITITAASDEWTYDGAAHENTEVTVTTGALLTGDTLSATATGSVTNVADTADGNNPIATGYKIMHGEEDVTANYTITPVDGKLTIKPAAVTVTAKSEEFTYDGTAHSNSGYDVDGLVGNDKITAVVEGSITFPSESPVANVVKSHEFTTGTPGNYTVSYVNGELTMTNAEVKITITAASDEWTYDGEAHENTEVTVTSGSLMTGDTLVATATGSVTNVADTADGNNPIAAGYKIMHGEEDVTANYTITPVAGKLTIKPKAVTVTAQDKAFTYTGEAQSWNKYDVDGLVGDDAITATVTGSITFPSESPVTNKLESYEFTVGTPGNYTVTTKDGKLTMTNASVEITITAASDKWTYDGEAHKNNAVTVTAGELLEGDELVATATGSVTNVADTAAGNNPIATGYKIMHGEEDVTANYVITPVAGKLTIEPKAVTVTAQDKEFTYTGEAQSWNKYDVDGLVGDDAISATVTGSITFPSESPVTNTLASYEFTTGTPGNYTVTTKDGKLTMTNANVEITITAASDKWTYDGEAHSNNAVTVTSGTLLTGDTLVATATGSVTNVADTAAGNNPIAAGYKIMHGEEDVTANYTITPVAGKLTIEPKAVTVTAQDKEFAYTGEAQSWNKYDVDGLVGDDAITATVTGSITFPSESPVTNKLESYEFTVGTPGNYTVTTKDGKLTMTNANVEITITAASDKWTYDGEAHENTEVTVTSGELLEGDTLVATATGSVTNVADTAAGNNPIAAGYKIMHGEEDVTANYAITPVAGKLTIEPKAVTVTAQDKEFTYTGEAQSWNKYDVDGLVGDDKITATVTGSITFPSESPVTNKLASYEFTTGTPGNYTVTTKDGKLTMTNASVEITITAASDEWTYDGEAHENTSVTVTRGELLTGDTLVATATGSVTNVADTADGNNPIAAGYKIMHGEEDVTANYVITPVAGKLTIEPKAVTVTAQDKEFAYTGEAQSWNKYDVDGLVGDDAITATVTGSITFPSESPVTNKLASYEFTTGTPGNYTVTTKDGKLTMTNASVAITITAASDKWTYDGEAHKNNAVTVTAGELLEGDTLVATATGSVTNVADTADGNNPIAAGYKIMHGEEDVTANYVITPVAGKLTIEPKAVTVTAKSEEFTYDGTAHSNSGYDVDGLVGNDKITAVVEGSITFPSESPVANEVKSHEFTTGTAGNYTVSYANGELTMKAASVKITITAASDEWTYDGAAHQNTEVTVTSGELLTGDTLVATATGSVTNVADTANGNNPIAAGYKIMHGEEDVTANYVITPVNGTLTINPKAVTVTAQDKEFAYTGEAQSWNKYDVEGLVGNDAITATVTGSITFPSESPVTNKLASYEFTTGTPGNYTVTTKDGKLTMTNASVAITITAASDEWTYDGEAHQNASVTVTSGELLEGDTLVATATGSVTNVADTAAGNNPIAAGYKIMHGEEDVTANYVITPVAGKLTINPKAVTVTAKSEEFTYDGNAHSNNGYDVSGLVGQDAITATVTGSITFPSESPVTNTLASYEFTTGTPGNYTVTTENGQLTMKNAEVAITITAASDEWTYDGAAHENTSVTVTSGTLLTGDTLVATATGSVTNVADTADGNNPIATGYKIMHGTEDVTANYVITPVDGTLTINPKAVTVTAKSEAFIYDGTAHSNAGYDVDGLVGNDKITAVVEGSITFPSESPVANVVKSHEFTTGTAGNYTVSYVDGELTMTNAEVAITITAASDEWTYDGEAHQNTSVTVTSGELLEGDTLVATATGSVTNVADTAAGNNPIAAGYKIMHGEEDVTANYAITTVAGKLTINPKAVTVTAKSEEFTYDGNAHSNNGYDVDGLVGNDAITATVTGSITFPSESPVTNTLASYEFTTGTPGNYTVTTANGQLTMKNAEVAITITAASDEWTYDGEAHSNNAVTVTSGQLLTGDTLVATATGSVTYVADTADGNNPIAEGYKIMHGEEDVTANYVITPVAGKLTINPKALTITADSDSKTYDGTPLTKDSYTNTALVTGDEIESVTITGSQTVVGTSNNVPSAAKIVNADGEDITSSYDITYANGTLEVTQKTLTITADSDSKVYDGTPLTKNSYTNTALAEGDEIDSVTITGSQTVVGTSNNVPSAAKIVNAAGDDVTASYNISYANGTLTVTQKDLTITADSDTKVYDGTPLTKNSYTNTALAEGDTIESVTVTGSQTVVGTSNNVPSAAKIVNAAGDDVTASYNITYVNGTLEVTPRPVTITADSDEKVYDGTPLTKDSAQAEGLATGDKLDSVTVTGSQTVAGSSNNVPSAAKIVNAAGDDVTACYTITYANGTLTVTQRDVTITADSDEKVYDGTPLTKDSAKAEGLATGDKLDSVTVTGSQTDVGSSDNVPSAAVIKNAAGDDVTASYNITYANGTLEVTPRPVTITADDANKIYGEEDPDLTATVVGAVDGETLDYIVTREEGETVGEYTITVTPTEGKNTNYEITTETGTLTINKRPITLQSKDAEKVYDGEELRKEEVKILGDYGLATKFGDTIRYFDFSSRTLVGSSPNEFDYEITQDATASGNGFTKLLSKLGILGEAYGDEIPDHVTNDIEKNYDITVEFGTLTVTDENVDPDDVLTKTHTDENGESQTFKVGETITFTIEVTNIYDEVKTITLTEIEGVTLEQSVFEDVEPGAVVTTTATYTVTEEDALAGTFKNTVKAEYSGEDEPFTNEDEVKDFAHMTVEKKVTNTPADGKAFKTGETIKYEITVTNDGTAELKDIVVKDELTGDEWKIDSLAAGKSKTFKAEYIVTEKDGAAGSVTNVATAEGTDPDGDKTPGTPGEVKTTTDKADEPVVPKTGDNTPIVEFSVIFGASIITLLMMLFRRKKERA